MIYTYPLAFENSFGQWTIALFALIFAILVGLLYAWFRYFQASGYDVNRKLLIGLLIIEGVSIALGFVFFGLLEVKVHLIWTSFVILPIVVSTYLLFLGHWFSNDYFVYESSKIKNSIQSVIPTAKDSDAPAVKARNRQAAASKTSQQRPFTVSSKLSSRAASTQEMGLPRTRPPSVSEFS